MGVELYTPDSGQGVAYPYADDGFLFKDYYGKPYVYTVKTIKSNLRRRRLRIKFKWME